jgi:hypothetical protein
LEDLTLSDTFYSVSIGAGLDPAAVAVAASTGSTVVELRTTDGAGLTKTQLLLALEAIAGKIAEGSAPL